METRLNIRIDGTVAGPESMGRVGTGIVFYDSKDEDIVDSFGVFHTVGNKSLSYVWALYDVLKRLKDSGEDPEKYLILIPNGTIVHMFVEEIDEDTQDPLILAVRTLLRHEMKGIKLGYEPEEWRVDKNKVTAMNIAKRAAVGDKDQQKRLMASKKVTDIKQSSDNLYTIKDYMVDWVAKTCTCKDFEYRCRDVGLYCKHILAVGRKLGEVVVQEEKTIEELIQEISAMDN